MLAEVPDAVGRRPRPAARLRPLPDPAFGSCSGRPSSAPGRRRASGCTRTPRRRCARPVTAPPGPRRTPAYEQAVHATVDAAFDGAEATARIEDLVERVAEPGWSNALASQADRADHARGAGRLSGQRALGAVPGRSRQPPPGRLRHPSRGAHPGPRRRAPGAHAAARRPRSRQAARHPGRAHAAPQPAPPLHDVRAGGGRRRRGRARRRLRPRRRPDVATRLPVGLAGARVGRHRARACPRASGRTCSPARVRRRRSCCTSCWPTTRSRC